MTPRNVVAGAILIIVAVSSLLAGKVIYDEYRIAKVERNQVPSVNYPDSYDPELPGISKSEVPAICFDDGNGLSREEAWKLTSSQVYANCSYYYNEYQRRLTAERNQ